MHSQRATRRARSSLVAVAVAATAIALAFVVVAPAAQAAPPTVGKVTLRQRLRNVRARGIVGNIRFLRGRLAAGVAAPTRVLRRKALGRVIPLPAAVKRVDNRGEPTFYLAETQHAAAKGEPLAVNTAGLTISGADYAGSIGTMKKLLQRKRSAHVVVGGGSYAGDEVKHVNEMLRMPGSKGMQLIVSPDDPANRTERAHRRNDDGSVKQFNAAVRVQKRGGVVHTIKQISLALLSGEGYKGLPTRRAVTD